MTKRTEQLKARELRLQGLAITTIAKQLGVAKSSVLGWTSDIVLTPEQMVNLYAGRAASVQKASDANKLKARTKREAWRKEGRLAAQEGNQIHAMGCMLYWGEGAKGRNSASISNTDEHLLRLFLRFMRECFGVEDDSVRLRVLYYTTPGITEDDIKQYWCDQLGLPISCFTPTQSQDVRMRSRVHKSNKWPYGVCTLSVHQTRIVQHIYGAIEEYADIERTRWLS